VKSRFFSRSAVIVIALATMSHWLEFRARPLCSGSNAESLTTSLRSSPLAISVRRSMSKPLKPVGEDSSKSSNGT